MQYFASVKHTLGRYADFSGRASRAEFWTFFGFVLLAGAVARLIDAIFFRWSPFGGPCSGLTSLLLFLPQVAVAVRRLHDVGRSGRDLVAPIVMLFVSPLVLVFGRGFLPQIVALGLAGMTLLLFANLLRYLTRRGGTVPNRYGASPSAFSFAG
ncbi:MULTISPECIES: DUF805 domain-containing protein [Sphingomonas]|uniref:DUF805 domain-containing protein n=1 Tax=Sphingomonas TaxID=13687 RepID=UPI000DEFB986|nr:MULTISPECIES: DUF805 domain-containing protein [Sphingomonas]